MAAALEDAIDASSAALADRLRADGPRMLAEQGQDRDGFEQRLRERWRSAFDLYEMVTVACGELGSGHYEAQLAFAAHGATGSEGVPIKPYVMTLLHARACLVASEVHALLRTGHPAGAQARWRTLHELATIASVLGKHDSDLSERYLLHSNVSHWKDAKCYQDNCQALGREPLSEVEMAALRSTYDTVIARYGDGYQESWGWAKDLFPSPKMNPNFDNLEKLAGLDHHKPFVKLSHHAIHGGATGALDILDLYGHGKVMLAGASDSDLAEPGHGSLIALYEVTASYILHAYDIDVDPQTVLALKAIAMLRNDAGEAFAACEFGIR